MAKRLIRSVVTAERNPAVAILLSLLSTGLGQIYNGELSKGIVFFALRVLTLLFIPLSFVVDFRSSSLAVFIALVLIHIFLWIAAAGEACISSMRKKKYILTVYNSVVLYCVFGCASTLILLFLFVPVSLFFRIETVPSNSMNPTLFRGESVVVNTYVVRSVKPGEVVFYRQGGVAKFGRVIATAGDAVVDKGGVFEINDVDLSLGVFTDDELDRMGLENSDDIFTENNGERRYPIRYLPSRGRSRKNRVRIAIEKGAVLVAPDNRRREDVYEIIPVTAVRGRVEGIVMSSRIRRIMLLPYIRE